MKRTIRDRMFETNSSSVHTLVYRNQVLSPSELPVDRNGYIVGHMGEFGRDERDYDSQEDKLSYLITAIAYGCGANYGGEYSRLCECYSFQELEEMLKEYTGAKGLRVQYGVNGYIDHQSVPYDAYECDLFVYTKENMKNFIFNDNVVLHTDCD